MVHTLRRQKAFGVLLTPDKASSSWWHLVQRDSLGVKGAMRLPDRPGLFLGRGKPLPRPSWKVRVVLLDFR